MGKRVRSIHPYRLSEHALNILNTCERKFQLDRMLILPEMAERSDSPILIRGDAFGVGVQQYMLTGDMDWAIYKAWLAYYPEVYDEQKKIYVWRMVNNLLCCKDELDKLRKRYKVAEFEGKPAIELSFKLQIDDKWYFVGYIDMVLYDTVANMYVVFEIKTTSYKIYDLRPMYQNSGQALGYSVVIDRIVGEKQSRYGVVYFVCRDQEKETYVPDVYTFAFTKTLLDRLRWFYTLGLDVQRLNTMLENDLFPMRGGACIQYNRPCPHFGICNTTASDIWRRMEDDTNEYQFNYDLQDLIQDHINRVKEVQTVHTELPREVPVDIELLD